MSNYYITERCPVCGGPMAANKRLKWCVAGDDEHRKDGGIGYHDFIGMWDCTGTEEPLTETGSGGEEEG